MSFILVKICKGFFTYYCVNWVALDFHDDFLIKNTKMMEDSSFQKRKKKNIFFDCEIFILLVDLLASMTNICIWHYKMVENEVWNLFTWIFGTLNCRKAILTPRKVRFLTIKAGRVGLLIKLPVKWLKFLLVVPWL